MIFTLGMNAVAQGLMVFHTGGFSPQDAVTPLMREMVVGHIIPGVANPVLIWLLLGIATVFVLTRTSLGRQIYAIGNRERAVFLSGVDTAPRAGHLLRHLGRLCRLRAASCSPGWSNRSFQAMGDTYLLPTIAAVVLGGTQRAWRARHVPRHGRRRHPDHAPAVDPVGGAAAVHAGRDGPEGAA